MSHAHASSSADLNPGRLFDCSRIVALVTGGATGIGEMAASGLIQGGAKVIIASRKESELKSKLLQSIAYWCWREVRKYLGTGSRIYMWFVENLQKLMRW
jgi:hypothetical protein